MAVIYGGNGSDLLMGTLEGDFIIGGGGDDVIDGNAGFDTIVLSGSANDYSMKISEFGLLVYDLRVLEG